MYLTPPSASFFGPMDYDGSVQWGDYFWLSTGAYAIVNVNLQIVECGNFQPSPVKSNISKKKSLCRVSVAAFG